jgi:cardiolipin synthase
MNNEKIIKLETVNLKIEFIESAKGVLGNLKKFHLQTIKLAKIKLLLGGDDYYYKLFSMIDGAQSHIFCLIYTLDDSNLANSVLKSLIQALNRGVKVFLVVDDLISIINIKHKQEIIDNGGIIITRNTAKDLFNMHDKSFFQRDHEKVVFADNQFLIGSANLASDYGGRFYGNNFFLDLNVYGKNCLIPEFADMLQDLILSMKTNINKDQLSLIRELKEYKKRYPIFTNFYSDSLKLVYCKQPFNMKIQNNLLKAIREAKESIKIIAPYYYPIKPLNEALVDASLRGINVEIITSLNRDVPAYKEFVNGMLFKKLLFNGVRVYEYGQEHLHAKGIIIDDSYLTIGSFNLDRWSWYNNIETMIEFYDRRAEIDQFKAIFDDIKIKSSFVRYQNNLKFLHIIKIRFWQTFLFLCDKLMNRGFYGYFQNMDSSVLEQMQTSMSWDFHKYQNYQLLKQADKLIDHMPLNEVKNHLI